ncbi:MAG TPA: hypothetical protein VI564_02870 [Candidatus Nanoarchaeia archaeon]|nr:hypothetical protein [Candidatus Nanoarchaeia archaeon]
MDTKLENYVTISEQELEELPKPCPKCDGEGQITQHGPLGVYNLMQCPECLGTAQKTLQFEIKGKPCKKCGTDGHLEKWSDRKKKNLKDIGICDKCSGNGILFPGNFQEDMDVTYKEIQLRVVASGIRDGLHIVKVIRKLDDTNPSEE